MNAILDFGMLNIPLTNIESAILRIYHYGGDEVNQGNTTFNIYPYSNQWKEDNITWNNHSDGNIPNEVGIEVTATENLKQNFTIDVLSILKSSDNSTNTSMILVMKDNGDENRVILASKENENSNLHPTLLITYRE